MNKESLLGQLKIERDNKSFGPARALPWLWILAALGVALLVSAAWFAVARPDLTRVTTVEAKAGPSNSAAGGGSLLDASGYVVARRAATVSSKITGKVTQVLIEEGEHVSAGQVMARLDDSNARAAASQAQAELMEARANLAAANIAMAHAGRKSQRYGTLDGKGVISAQAIDDARNEFEAARSSVSVSQSQTDVAKAKLEGAQRALDDTVVRAPFAGIVTVKAAQPGEMVSPVSAGGGFTRTGIGTVVDMNSLEVQVDVSESVINRVSRAMPAVVKLNAYPDWAIPAEVIAVIPTADRAKATVTVRVGLRQRDDRIVPEMGAHVSFLSGDAAAKVTRSVTVPSGAVQTRDGGQAVVFVIADGRAERRSVQLGDSTPKGQVVRSGVSPGEAVAVDGASRLKDGDRVKVKTGKTAGN